MLDAVDRQRIVWNIQQSKMMPAFLAIKRHATKNGTMTFKADRLEDIAHADDFWALSHALMLEGLDDNKAHESEMTFEFF